MPRTRPPLPSTQPAAARTFGRWWTPMLLALAALTLTGCANGVLGKKTVQVEAEHRGLAGQHVAVMVAADDRTLFYSPKAPERICRVVTGHLVEQLPQMQATSPRQVIQYQDDNPYWATKRASQLIEQMDVQRLVLIDLVEYRTREPGNAHVFKGQVTANVAVHSADSDDPDNPTFYHTVSTQFPRGTTLGVVNANTQDIELGMVKLFGHQVARLFYDHEVQRE